MGHVALVCNGTEDRELPLSQEAVNPRFLLRGLKRLDLRFEIALP
jgi:hypothetical protein